MSSVTHAALRLWGWLQGRRKADSPHSPVASLASEGHDGWMAADCTLWQRFFASARLCCCAISSGAPRVCRPVVHGLGLGCRSGEDSMPHLELAICVVCALLTSMKSPTSAVDLPWIAVVICVSLDSLDSRIPLARSPCSGRRGL